MQLQLPLKLVTSIVEIALTCLLMSPQQALMIQLFSAFVCDHLRDTGLRSFLITLQIKYSCNIRFY